MSYKAKLLSIVVALVTSLAAGWGATQRAAAQPVIPPTWDIVSDDFEAGDLAAWRSVTPERLSLLAGGGRAASNGLAVTVSQEEAYISRSRVAKATEGYLTFWFNPNDLALPEPTPNHWPPGSALGVANIRSSASDWWPPLVGLYVRQPTGQAYQGFMAWPKASGYFYDYQDGAFELADGWQKITLGYHINAWVAIWVNDTLVRYVESDLVHDDPYGDVIEVGKINANSQTTPSGSIRFDEVYFQIPRIDDLWVDAEHGDDDNDGHNQGAALRTVQRAADLAGPGTHVHILPGVYRETVWPAMSGSATEAVLYAAENGPDTVYLRGAEPSSSLTWTLMSTDSIGLPSGVYTHVYYADLSAWELTATPRFVVELDGAGEISARLPLAREPDWSVVTEWKHHEFWWAADGGAEPAACDPATDDNPNCDLPQRSMTQLTDRTHDSAPAGVEPGNLTTLGDLTGGVLIAIDSQQGHYVYRRTITAHDVTSGRVTVDRKCEHDNNSGKPGLGWGSKYYVENKPALLDTPGEWWYDPDSRRLYLWPRAPGDPAGQPIEISRRDNGFSLRNCSYTTLDGLTIELFNRSAIYLANWDTHKAYSDTVRHARLRYANWGVYLEQSLSASSPAGNRIDGFVLEQSEIAMMDTLSIRLIDWWENNAAADSFVRSGIQNTVIRDNSLHHLGFRTDDDNAIGAAIFFANRLRFERNHVHHVAHNGVQFLKSVIQSPKEYGFTPDEIKTGRILIKDNIFEKACQLTTDCGGLKIWGSPPDTHVFRDMLVTGNIFRDTFGWTYVSEKRGRWTGGKNSEVRGLGGFGLYVDMASGVHAYRNLAYNNAFAGYMASGVWRDGEIVYVNNVAANSLYGFSLGGGSYDTHGSVNTQVINNIIANNEGFGLSLSYAASRTQNITLDRNLYHNNGWRVSGAGGMWGAGALLIQEGSGYTPYQTLAEAQAATPWEDHGLSGDPVWRDYDLSDHDMHDNTWPDFHLTSASLNAIDKGSAARPSSLQALLEMFDIDDYRTGTAWDIGRYEAGFNLYADPLAQTIAPGGVARYSLRLLPSDLSHAVTLTVASPSPGLAPTLSAPVITPAVTVTLSVAHDGSAAAVGNWYTLPVTGSGGGFVQVCNLRLLVGGRRIYLPLTLKGQF